MWVSCVLVNMLVSVRYMVEVASNFFDVPESCPQTSPARKLSIRLSYNLRFFLERPSVNSRCLLPTLKLGMMWKKHFTDRCFSSGAKLLWDGYNPVSLFPRFRLVHADHSAEMLSESWRIPFERDFQDCTFIFLKNVTIGKPSSDSLLLRKHRETDTYSDIICIGLRLIWFNRVITLSGTVCFLVNRKNEKVSRFKQCKTKSLDVGQS